MSPENRQALEYLEVRGYYTSTYTQIVQPERIVAVTDYFRRYWVPLLKPGPAWLVVALRQRCFWNGQSNRCIVSRERLAQESGVAVRTADNYLDLPLVDWFVTGRRPRYSRTKEGTKRRDWTQYELRLDEPLTPAHQAALAALAAEAAAGCDPAAGPAGLAAEIAQRLLDLDPAELVRRMDLTTKDTKDTKDAGGEPLSVVEIIEAAANRAAGAAARPADALTNGHAAPDPSLTRACDALYARIVRPDQVRIATQYFRLSWMPLLGAARAWLILHLRARCYLNTHDLEVRDTCTVGGLAELAAALGVSISTVKTCLAGPPADAFLTHLATHRPAAGRVEMAFRVEMIDPLTPADAARAAALPGDQQPDFAASPPDQRPDFAGSLADQQPESTGSSPHQQPDFADSGDQRPESAASAAGQQPESAGIDGAANGQDLQDTKELAITTGAISTQQHQVLVPAGHEPEPLAAAAGPPAAILAGLGIQEPVRSRIAALNPPAGRALAWALEAWSVERIENKAGFVASMLLAGHSPPPELEALAGLTVAEWRALARAARQARAGGRAAIAAGLAGHFEALYSRYGRLDPARWPVLLPGLEETAPEEEPEEEEEAPPADDDAEAGQVWEGVLVELRGQMDPATFNAWLKGSRVARVDGGRWTVAVRSETAAGWLSHRLRPVVERAVGRLAGEMVEIEFEASKT